MALGKRVLGGMLASALAIGMVPGALAQENGPEKVTQIPVYGDDPCEPSANEDEIIVCVRFEESERYRIPPNLRGDPSDPANQAWIQRVQSFETVGATGIGSCTPNGPGGALGCTTRLIDQAFAERRQGAGAQASRLIDEAREERLSRIDDEAQIMEAAELEREAELAARRRAAEEEAAAEGREPDPVPEDLAAPPPESE